MVEEICFVMIEWYLNGCVAHRNIKGVTKDQQYAFDWSLETPDEFTNREVQTVPFI